MSYADIGTYLFFLWWGGCWLAYWLSLRSHANRDTRMIPLLFGITIATFYIAMHGRAGHWHHWWYAWNSIPNFTLLLIGWYAVESRARWPVIVFSVMGVCVDATYFGFAASGNRLPGQCYFCAAATVETLQVLSMIYFSGPVEPLMSGWFARAWTFIRTRKYPWTHHPRLWQKV